MENDTRRLIVEAEALWARINDAPMREVEGRLTATQVGWGFYASLDIGYEQEECSPCGHGLTALAAIQSAIDQMKANEKAEAEAARLNFRIEYDTAADILHLARGVYPLETEAVTIAPQVTACVHDGVAYSLAIESYTDWRISPDLTVLLVAYRLSKDEALGLIARANAIVDPERAKFLSGQQGFFRASRG